MRLCIATPLYPPEPGGPATYARILEHELPKQGVETVLVKYRDVRKYPVLLRHCMYFLSVYRAGKRADAIFALDPVSTGLPALYSARLLRKPFILKIVGDYAWEQGRQRFGITATLDDFVRKGRVPFPVACMRAIQTHVAHSASRIIVPSKYLKDIISQWGIPEEKIEVIYNAMQTEAPDSVPAKVETLTRPRVVTVGRLVPWKHIDGIVDAIATLKTGNPSLVIVGDGPEHTSLATRAAEKLGARAVFTGALSHRDTLATIADADVFVLNSSYEGFSHLLIEALSLGVPVIATRVGGNAELITDGENGLLVGSGDTEALAEALEKVLVDAEFARALRARAKTSSLRYTTDAMIEKTLALLHTLV